jgi:glutamate-1-semialdehyde 2,1-aminomutase
MQSHHASTFRHIPASSKPVSPERVAQVLADEWKLFTKNTAGSAAESKRAFASLPLGVTSSFQHWDPYPISIASAEGAWMTDVDGRKLLDLSMGFGAMLAGHLNPIVVEEIQTSLRQGMLFVTPSPTSTDAAERICKRFGIDQVRFTNSGTESTMYAVRVARSITAAMTHLLFHQNHHLIKLAIQISQRLTSTPTSFQETSTSSLSITLKLSRRCLRRIQRRLPALSLNQYWKI